jgi:hypothetical protein
MSTPAPQFQVFLSYSRLDSRIVRGFHRRLLARGITVWMDVENILGGEDWRTAIRNAIRGSQLMLIFLSRKVVAREGYLQYEILEALDESRRKPPGQIFLIPVRLDDCAIHPRLEPFQCASLATEHARKRLLRQIEECRQLYLD